MVAAAFALGSTVVPWTASADELREAKKRLPEFKVLKGKGIDVCEAYLKRLNGRYIGQSLGVFAYKGQYLLRYVPVGLGQCERSSLRPQPCFRSRGPSAQEWRQRNTVRVSLELQDFS